jgi:hypothetical protein
MKYSRHDDDSRTGLEVVAGQFRGGCGRLFTEAFHNRSAPDYASNANREDP